jgi:NADH dehydrogenase FAD-containing subunit
MGRIGCTVNVAVGMEASLDEALIVPVSDPKTVLVVGGGPAGLEAARVAALCGQKVILAEASADLGGAVNVAKRAPRRMGIGDITEWLERQVYALGVDVRLGTYIDGSDVRDIAPDVVIVATGSLPRMGGGQFLSPGQVASGIERRHVVSSHDLLLENSNRNWGTRAVVYDDTGHYEAVAAAEFLIDKGVAVTFVTGHSRFAPGLEPSLSAEPALERLAKGDFRFVPYARLATINEDTVDIAYRYGGHPLSVPADTVVFVSHNACNRMLIDELADWSGTVIPVGDARSPRYLQTAIREGHMAARGIG